MSGSPSAEGGTGAGVKKYGSDLIVDLLNLYGIPFCAINPGATFRGIHDSLVNYAGNRPEIIVCPHEKVALGVAHGYAKATGKPAAAIVHNVVGMLHGALGFYYAYCDRAPMLVLGGTGPMNAAKRRPRIDWDHTALVQGNALRDYVKWDDQPSGVDAIVDSIARGYRVAMTPPQGPVYLCFDVEDQEAELDHDIPVPDAAKPLHYSAMQADPDQLRQAAELLAAAKSPVIVADYIGPRVSAEIQALAESLGAPVVHLYGRYSLPGTHPLHWADMAPLQEADAILALDVRDLYGCLVDVHHFSRQPTPRAPLGCKVVEVGPGDVAIKAWSLQYQKFVQADVSLLADAESTLAPLLAAIEKAGGVATPERQRRLAYWTERKAAQRKQWLEKAAVDWNASGPMTVARFAAEIGQAIKGKDWVLTANTANGWAHRLWDFDQPYRYPGKALGTATQVGIALGVGMAYRGTGKLVVDIQPDGDLMFDAGSLWVAAHHRIPMLMVMYNNRAYYNDWEHQKQIATQRRRSLDNIHVGEEIADPAPDFATLARSFGWYSEGPIDDPAKMGPALQRAIAVIEQERRPALVDCITRYR